MRRGGEKVALVSLPGGRRGQLEECATAKVNAGANIDRLRGFRRGPLNGNVVFL